jgi:clan AA aspartic protease
MMRHDETRMPTHVGITFTKVRVANPYRWDVAPVEIEFLIDTGTIYSVAPASVLEQLGLSRIDREEFTLADGTHVAYDIGEALFVVGDRTRTALIVFAPEGVTPLLGALTLEALGLMVNPVTRELLPMRLLLARVGTPPERVVQAV